MRAIKDHEAFILPGGRLEILENSYEAIRRELEEELGLELEYKLISIEENIVKDNKFHMLEFVFYCRLYLLLHLYYYYYFLLKYFLNQFLLYF